MGLCCTQIGTDVLRLMRIRVVGMMLMGTRLVGVVVVQALRAGVHLDIARLGVVGGALTLEGIRSRCCRRSLSLVVMLCMAWIVPRGISLGGGRLRTVRCRTLLVGVRTRATRPRRSTVASVGGAARRRHLGTLTMAARRISGSRRCERGWSQVFV